MYCVRAGVSFSNLPLGSSFVCAIWKMSLTEFNSQGYDEAQPVIVKCFGRKVRERSMMIKFYLSADPPAILLPSGDHEHLRRFCETNMNMHSSIYIRSFWFLLLIEIKPPRDFKSHENTLMISFWEDKPVVKRLYFIAGNIQCLVILYKVDTKRRKYLIYS